MGGGLVYRNYLCECLFHHRHTLDSLQNRHMRIPSPVLHERPTEYADRVGEWYVSTKTQAYRKGHGLYLTPVAVADFMAGKLHPSGGEVRLLDPAAGAGILCCAAVEALLEHERPPESVGVVAYEVDAGLVEPLSAVFGYLTEWCRTQHGVTVDVQVRQADFVMAHAGALEHVGGLFPHTEDDGKFDIVISNPPYFKLSKTDPRAAAAASVVHGQPNIYALFMAVSAALLRQNGEFVCIAPRSFTSGEYFRRFRDVFFDMIRPTQVHVFGSRRDTFSRHEVLQENVVLAGTRCDRWSSEGDQQALVVSSSRGIRDIGDPSWQSVPLTVALDLNTDDKVLRLPQCPEDERVLAMVDSWPYRLADLDMNISTGPVVAFRAADHIEEQGQFPNSHVPLLWMNHVQEMQVTWPLNGRKAEYISRFGAAKLLVPNENYVLLRRFSSKEQPRRLTAAPYIARELETSAIGLENHLNYVHRPNGRLSEDEVWGLAALYNSHLLDTYFRCVNGNTQVSATELRAMPLPKHDVIIALGKRVKQSTDPTENLDPVLMELVSDQMPAETVVG